MRQAAGVVEASELDEKMFAFNYERSSNSR